jgi:ATP-dependent DNA helicase RecG
MYLYANEGIKSDSIMNATGTSRATIVRYTQILKELDILEFRGAPKTGGYYITKRFKKKLE